tara:strand:- start:13367 stop:13969 length:603 start_codon:yes stop_codon:yes gene_type:complete
MQESYTQDQSFIKAQKKVKDIMGLYTHFASTIFIIPFNILINLILSPQFHWFWFFIGAWILGLFIHWLNVLGLSKTRIKSDWKQKKLKEIMNEESDADFNEIESNHMQELFYINAKKKAKEIKGFYIFLMISLVTITLAIYVNLEFVPGFHFFWFAIGGMLFPLFMMWLGIFGFKKLGLGKNWQQKKIKELMEEDKKHKL